MAAHPGIRRVAKWAGAILCLAISCLGAVSTRYSNRYTFAGPAEALIELDYGRIDWALSSSGSPAGWAISDAGGFITPEWWLLPAASVGLTEYSNGVPLWLILAVLAPTTATLWYRDRRRTPPGH